MKERHTLVVNEDLQLAVGDNKEGCPRGSLLDHLILGNVLRTERVWGLRLYGSWETRTERGNRTCLQARIPPR